MFKPNQFLILALIATSLMAGLVYTIEWPQERKIASKVEEKK